MTDTVIITPSPAVNVTVAATTSSNTQVVSPIVNTGTATGPIIGINQSLLAIAQSQVSGLVTLLAAKAPLADPAFTGIPTAPTATSATNNTQIATTAFVGTAVSNLIAAAPAALDTLNELAAALNNDAAFSTTVTTALSNKVSLTGSYSNPLWITGLAWSKISTTPTTLSGYGITDAEPTITAGTTAQYLRGDKSLATFPTAVSSFTNDSGYLTSVPVASTSVSGTVKVDGSTITINGSGVISGANTYSLPTASASVLGGIKVGSNLSIDGSSVLSATVPIASSTNPIVDGTVAVGSSTTYARADHVHPTDTTRAALGSANAFTVGGHSITAESATIKPLILKGAASQSADLLQLQDSAGTVLSNFTSAGGLNLTSRLLSTANSAASTPIISRGVSGQSGDLLQVQNNGSTNLAVISSTGTFRTAGLITAGDVNNVLGQLTVYSTATSRIGAVIRGATSQSANLQEWQNDVGTVLSKITSTGIIQASNGAQFGTSSSYSAVVNVNTGAVGNKGIVVQALASQTANLQEWQDSSGTVLATVGPTGTIGFSGSGSFLSAVTGRGVFITNDAASAPMTVKGATSQSANLQEWQNSGGTVLAYVGSGGVGRFEQLQVNSGYAQLRYSNSGGHVQMTRKTASMTNPGANEGAIYFVAGTTTGTLKLVTLTGASGIEETIVDNLSSTGSTAGAKFVGAGGVNTAGTLTAAGLTLSSTTSPITLNASVGTSGQVLTSAGAGATPTWTTVSGGSLGWIGSTQTTASSGGTTSLAGINTITGAAGTDMAITSAASGNGNLNLNTSGTGIVNINPAYTTRPSGSISIRSTNPGSATGGHIYIQPISAGSGLAGNVYIDATYDESSTTGKVLIGSGVDGVSSQPSEIRLGASGAQNLYLDSKILGGVKFSGNGATAPLLFTASPSLASVTSDSVDYNGDFLTLTPGGGSGTIGREAIQAYAWAYSNADATSATTNTAQSIFQSGARALTLEANKTYYFRLNLSLNFTFSTVSASIQLVPTFSQAPVAVNYGAIFISGTSGGVQSFRITTTGAQTISPTLGSSTTGATSIVEGFFRTNATTGGTVEFKYQINTGGGSSAVAKVGSLQQVMKIGAGAPGIVSGAWA